MPAPALRDARLAELDAPTLYRILQLRSEVFVVEQACVYLDPDGLDLALTTRQLWFEAGDGAVLATARILDGGDARRIGRIATAAAARGGGLGARLVQHFVSTAPGPWVLEAQSHLVGWYAGFGFEVSGAEYLDDGVLHTPMRRPLP